MATTRKAKKAAKGNHGISHGTLRWLVRYLEREEAIRRLGLTDAQVAVLDRIDRGVKSGPRKNKRQNRH